MLYCQRCTLLLLRVCSCLVRCAHSSRSSTLTCVPAFLARTGARSDGSVLSDGSPSRAAAYRLSLKQGSSSSHHSSAKASAHRRAVTLTPDPRYTQIHLYCSFESACLYHSMYLQTYSRLYCSLGTMVVTIADHSSLYCSSVASLRLQLLLSRSKMRLPMHSTTLLN